jgi:hypothetical protein
MRTRTLLALLFFVLALLFFVLTFLGRSTVLPASKPLPKAVTEPLDKPYDHTPHRDLEYQTRGCIIWFFIASESVDCNGFIPGEGDGETLFVQQQIPRKYIASWFLHFSSTKAVVRQRSLYEYVDNKIHKRRNGRYVVEILDAKTGGTGHPFFDCYLETTGPRCDVVRVLLKKPYRPLDKETSLWDFIEAIAQTEPIPFMFDPDTDPWPKQDVVVKPVGATIGDALQAVFDQFGWTYTVQGAVVYVHKKAK